MCAVSLCFVCSVDFFINCISVNIHFTVVHVLFNIDILLSVSALYLCPVFISSPCVWSQILHLCCMCFMCLAYFVWYIITNSSHVLYCMCFMCHVCFLCNIITNSSPLLYMLYMLPVSYHHKIFTCAMCASCVIGASCALSQMLHLCCTCFMCFLYHIIENPCCMCLMCHACFVYHIIINSSPVLYVLPVSCVLSSCVIS